MKKFLKYISYFLIILLTILILVNFYVLSFSLKNVFNSILDIQNKPVGLVLGASIKSNGQPSDILRDRLKVVAEAYLNDKINKIIVSGDNSKLNYNEPEVMKKYLVSLGIKKTDIYEDFAGFDTYDSLYRANHIFDAKNIVVFTQRYHIYRAVYIGNKLGIKTIGVTTDLHKYVGIINFEIREFFARIKAFIEADILKTETKYNKDIKIEIK